jgi:uncharacterized protein (TIGR00269 family)
MNLNTIKTCSTQFGTKIEGDPARLAALEERVRKTIADYDMISPQDNILVAVSGGKDSTVLLALLHKFGYNVSAVTVDAHIGCYSEENVKNIKSFCKQLDVPLYVASFNENYGSSVCYITEVLQSKGNKLGTCTVCGVLRRQLINKAARELGATKVALGHNMDDEVQAFLMNMFKNRESLNARLGPVPGLIKNDAFVQRIKPLFFVSEDDIAYYSQSQGYPVAYGECPCSVKSYRYAIKQFIKDSEHLYPDMKENFMKFMMTQLPLLRKKHKKETTPNECTICGEPAAADVCRSCDILTKFKQAS